MKSNPTSKRHSFAGSAGWDGEKRLAVAVEDPLQVTLGETGAVPDAPTLKAQGWVDAGAILLLVLVDDGVAPVVVLRFQQSLEGAVGGIAPWAMWVESSSVGPKTDTTQLRA